MRTAFLLVLTVGLATGRQEGQERPKVPKDSIEVTVTGCLKGRVLAASDVRQTDVQSGPVVRAHSFRLAGKKDVMNDVKREDGRRVEATGLIRKSALIEPGVRIKGGRIVIGGGSGGAAPGASNLPDPGGQMIVMDVSSLRALGGSCATGG